MHAGMTINSVEGQQKIAGEASGRGGPGDASNCSWPQLGQSFLCEIIILIGCAALHAKRKWGLRHVRMSRKLGRCALITLGDNMHGLELE